jgi:hypothetical protein
MCYGCHKHTHIHTFFYNIGFLLLPTDKTWFYMYMDRSFNSGTDFFVSERVDLMAGWSSLLRSSVFVLVCTYSIVPATAESTSGSHFL